MGYRSEWALIVRGPADKLATWRTRLVEMSTTVDPTPTGYFTTKDVATTILQHERVVRSSEDAAFLFHATGTKCYDPWDRVIRELLWEAREELGIKAAYARLGEEDPDQEFDNDDGLYVPFRREIALDDMVGIEDAGPAWLDEEP